MVREPRAMHSCRSLWALPKPCKNGVVAEFIVLKALEGVLYQWQKLSLTPLVLYETCMQRYGLSEEDFGYNYGCLKT